MSSWREEYIKSLNERDEREKASYERFSPEFIEAYTKLLDRTAALEAEKAASTPSSEPVSRDPALPIPANDGTAQIRRDLAEALRANGQLKSRIAAAEKELVALRAKAKTDTKLVQDLTKERAVLAQKVRDRDEELKGKAKFLVDSQDEISVLNLQLDSFEKQVKKLKADNQQLIDRWMASKGLEADEMNKALGG
ncbi:hypothetical protein M430DRAFT_20862 [Amorphotheca resinae ATCC 22711]|uniref:Autophagy-related protein 16 domain-containing protein n=1 Tax=Amorphotheca resinae ATCC 22711 TaxID=857342 RepID=A0A2T3AWA3_AMORE|nr:hypothetical protein M430DRAFT_20862 [Amorphotheca resinae ATCC 22711]PSS12948.1 hypothetical protein M430DRAFT_20862 [Amorphotheca resinae ATCC 22711]